MQVIRIMDWNLKIPSWDLTDFEQAAIPNIDLVNGSSSSGGQGIKMDFSVDLKLGQVVDSGNELGDNFKVPNVPKMALSPSGSSKRARGTNNGTQTAMCLADGCNSNLNNCREYHRRHKVCELHSKTPQVTINGHKQRFCQQCSRFHSLEEFDEGKRSCRKRLDGHNRRRRKPQPEPLSHAGSFFPSHQGTRLLQFSNPQVYPTTGVANPVWARIVKAQEDVKLYNHQSHPAHPHLPEKHNAFSESYFGDKRGKQLSFVHSTNLELSNQSGPESSVCQPLLINIASSGSGGASNKMFCDGFSTRVFHSDCALSLLSSSPTQTSDIGLSHEVQPNSIPVAHPLDSGLNYSSLEPMESILVPNVSNADVHSMGMFPMAPHAARGNETPQTLPFYWE